MRVYSKIPLSERLLSKVEFDTNGGCWLWSGAINPAGYGVVQIGRSEGARLAHRASYKEFVGEIGNLHVCHKCDVRRCINPNHLWLGTRKENMQDAKNKGRTRGPRLVGSSNPASKLTEENVLDIRDACKDAPRGTQRRQAEKYGMSEAVISAVVGRRRWTHV